MSDPILPPDPSEPPSAARRWLIGCGCGCLGLLIAVVVALYFSASYLYGAGEQLPSDHLVQPESVAVVHMSAPMADAETRAFLIDLLSAVPPASLEGAGGSADTNAAEDFASLIEMLRNLDDADVGFGPSSMTMVFQPDGDELASAFAVNLPRGSRFLRLMVRFGLSSAATEHVENGRVLYELGSESLDPDELEVEQSGKSLFIGFQHDTPIFGSSKRLLYALLEATDFDEAPGQPAEAPLRGEVDDLRSDWLISAALLDHPLVDVPAVLAFGLDAPPEDMAWAELPFERARLGLGIQGQDLALRLEVRGLAPRDVETLRAGLDQLASRYLAELSEDGLELAFETLAGEDSLLLQASLPNLRDWLTDRIAAAEPVEPSR